MAKARCFPALLAGKKKQAKNSSMPVNFKADDESVALRLKLAKLVELSNEKNTARYFDVAVPFMSKGRSPCDEKITGDDNMKRAKALIVKAAYEGGDEHEILSMRREFSDFNLQAQLESKGDTKSYEIETDYDCSENKSGNGMVEFEVAKQSGHVSDPGMAMTTALWGLPIVKRSCSNIETRITRRLPQTPSKSLSYDDLHNLSGEGSQLSAETPCSADMVMLKKQSSSQVLPSRSKMMWWGLSLSHRNPHKLLRAKPIRLFSSADTLQQEGGYSSDAHEPNHSFAELINEVKGNSCDTSNSNLRSGKQWAAFSMETSPLDRVNAWVNSLEDSPDNLTHGIEYDDGLHGEGFASFTTHETGESSGKNYSQSGRHLAEDVLRANSIIQSLNSPSSRAHISGMGLKVIPAISSFSSLRSLNLSNNYIVQVTPGSLPKSLHTLDLSRNKITNIEGLRELARLRVLNLSHNKISKIGHGLSSCTLIKELCLAGNKISIVEGLHRLLKLTVLDMSFNKITTVKSLGQLVANYYSLLSLNLLGNTIHNNIGDEQLRKAVLGILPQLMYLNKQPVKPQRGAKAVTDGIAKAALGSDGWSSRRTGRRVTHGFGSSAKGQKSGSCSDRGHRRSDRCGSGKSHQHPPSRGRW